MCIIQIIHPSEKRVLCHDPTFTEWFSCTNRISELYEMKEQ